MIKLFNAYRVLAITVGVFLMLASIDWLIVHLVDDTFPDLWWLWMIHGYVYMAYLIVAIPFIRRTGWPTSAFVQIIVAGLIPLLMFFVERRVAAKFKAEHPELFGQVGSPA